MHILFTRFPLTSAEGGAENQTTWLMNGLKERGHTVSFLGSCPVMLRRAAELNIENEQLIIGLPPVTKFGAVSFLWRKTSMQRTLIETLASRPKKPDVIVMLSLSEKLLLTEWAVEHHIRVVWVEHDTVGRWLTKNPWLSTLRRLSASVTTVCVSELSKKIYIDLGWPSEKTVAIPNGVPTPSSPIPKSDAGAGLHLGCIARLSEEKGVDILLSAIRDIPDVTLTLVGHGPDEGYIRELIQADAKHHGTERVQIFHHIEDLEPMYASFDALVLPSIEHDPFGLTAAEAMMRGVPVIVTNLSGIAGYLQDGRDALIVPAASESALAEAISKLLDSGTRERLAKEGKITAGRSFDLVHMVTAYENVFFGGSL